MKQRRLDFLDRDASILCLGSVPFGSTMDDDLSFAIMDTFVGLGGNFIDTARVYGDFENHILGLAEETIGRWMKARGNRENIVLATKGAHPPTGQNHQSRMTPEEIIGDVQDSLGALQTDYIDIYYLHRDDETKPVSMIMDTLNLFIKTGEVKALGASNWSPERIARANLYCEEMGLQGFKIDQPQWALARQVNVEDDTLVQMDKGLYDFHMKTKMPCAPYTSQAKGFFSKLYEGGVDALGDKARRRYEAPENMGKYEALLEIHKRTGMGIGALSLAYLTSQPFPVTPIVGVSSVSQAKLLEEPGEAALSSGDVDLLNRLSSL